MEVTAQVTVEFSQVGEGRGAIVDRFVEFGEQPLELLSHRRLHGGELGTRHREKLWTLDARAGGEQKEQQEMGEQESPVSTRHGVLPPPRSRVR